MNNDFLISFHFLSFAQEREEGEDKRRYTKSRRRPYSEERRSKGSTTVALRMSFSKGKESNERSHLLREDEEDGSRFRDIKEELALQTRAGMNADFSNPNEARVESTSIVGLLINFLFFILLLPILLSFYTVRHRNIKLPDY